MGFFRSFCMKDMIDRVSTTVFSGGSNMKCKIGQRDWNIIAQVQNRDTLELRQFDKTEHTG